MWAWGESGPKCLEPGSSRRRGGSDPGSTEGAGRLPAGGALSLPDPAHSPPRGCVSGPSVCRQVRWGRAGAVGRGGERGGERRREVGRGGERYTQSPVGNQQRKWGKAARWRRARDISSAAGASPRASGAAGQGVRGSGGGDRAERPWLSGHAWPLCPPRAAGAGTRGSAACDSRAGSRGTQSCLLGPCRQHAEGQGKGCAGSTRPRTAWPTILPQSASRKPRTSALHPRSEAPCGHRGCGQGLARMGKSSPALQGVTPVGPSERRPCLFIAGCPLCQTCSPEVRDPATWGTWGGR